MTVIRNLAAALILLLIIMIGACTAQKGPEKKPQGTKPQSASQQLQVQPEVMAKIKEIALQTKGVDETAAVVLNKEASVAIKVSGFNRLHLKQVKREVHNSIKKAFKDYRVNVTSDKKLFSEIQKIEQQVSKNPGGLDLIQIKNKLNKINQDMKG